MAATAAAANIGHNQPDPAEALRDELNSRHGRIVARRDELLDAATRVPEVIENDEMAGRVQDYVKQLAACFKTAETTRIGEKEPYLSGARIVDGFFKAITDPVEKVKRGIESRLTLYLRKKADEERRARDEAARIAREAEERARKDAEAAAATATTETELAGAIDAEAVANQAQANATAAAEAAAAKPAELSRTRGDFGSVASLRATWTFADLDRNAIDLEALRAHLPTDALEKAVRAFIKAGGRALPGVRIYEETTAVVR